MTLKRISALVFSLIFGVLSLASGTLLVLGGVWAGLILWIPGALLLGLAVKMNTANRP